MISLIIFMGVKTCLASEWHLYINSSKKSFKAVLLNKGNKCASIPITHSTYMK